MYVYIYIYIYIHKLHDPYGALLKHRRILLADAPSYICRAGRCEVSTHFYLGNFASQDIDICLSNVCGCFEKNCGDLRRLPFSPSNSSSFAEICGDGESAQKLRRTNIKVLAREIP